MPKRSGNNKRRGGRRNNRGKENKWYYGHDDRTKHSVFKPYRRDRSRVFPLVQSNGYKIIIPFGNKYEKDEVIHALLSCMPPLFWQFIPIMYKVIGTEASFYIDDHKTANALLRCDRKVRMNDGFRLQVKVKPGLPICEIDEKMKERLKQAMVKRYVPEKNALDLSKFHVDSDLYSDYFCALCHPVMLMAVLDIVGEHIPNLEELNLEGNELQNLEILEVLNKKFSKLKILYIGDNKIQDIKQLNCINNLKLEELTLSGNPICNRYKSRHSEYTSDLRKRFPRLLRLDGKELPRPIIRNEQLDIIVSNMSTIHLV
ncbi:PREDICTED: nuclear RNA export factor 1-like isoform X2 [Vollenhovia emeryi]|nr:PREDICTED: nuclear RNA export factor 1-like isoform X2 [Vollenhovia emeryi]